MVFILLNLFSPVAWAKLSYAPRGSSNSGMILLMGFICIAIPIISVFLVYNLLPKIRYAVQKWLLLISSFFLFSGGVLFFLKSFDTGELMVLIVALVLGFFFSLCPIIFTVALTRIHELEKEIKRIKDSA